MTVQELIDELSKIEDKSKSVYVNGGFGELLDLDCPEVMDSCLTEFEGEAMEFVLIVPSNSDGTDE